MIFSEYSSRGTFTIEMVGYYNLGATDEEIIKAIESVADETMYGLGLGRRNLHYLKTNVCGSWSIESRSLEKETHKQIALAIEECLCDTLNARGIKCEVNRWSYMSEKELMELNDLVFGDTSERWKVF